MSFKTKLPPIILLLNIEKYNLLLSILNNVNSTTSKKLKDNFLKYSYIIDKDHIEIRLYHKDAAYIIQSLLSNIYTENMANYYEELKNIKKIKGD